MKNKILNNKLLLFILIIMVCLNFVLLKQNFHIKNIIDLTYKNDSVKEYQLKILQNTFLNFWPLQDSILNIREIKLPPNHQNLLIFRFSEMHFV